MYLFLDRRVSFDNLKRTALDSKINWLMLDLETQDKLQFLAGQSSGYIDTLPKDVKRRVKALQGLQVG